MRVPTLLLAVSLSLLPSLRSEAASFRCGKRIVAEGSTKAELLLACGEPDAKDARTELLEVGVKERGADGDTVHATRTVTVTWEEWTYNFGRHSFVQTVVFRNGRLVDVRSGDYGT